MPLGGLCPWPSFHAWVTIVRKKRLSLYYSTYWCYIHQTCTNCSSWHDLLMPGGGLCPWPTFHTWVTMVRKKWLSLYYSTYWCYIHQTCRNCSTWHDLLMPHWLFFYKHICIGFHLCRLKLGQMTRQNVDDQHGDCRVRARSHFGHIYWDCVQNICDGIIRWQ